MAFKRSIVVPATASSYKVLSSDAYTKHGLSAHGIIFDEVHAQPNRELWDVLTTSVGARRQPLTVAITTAAITDTAMVTAGEVMVAGMTMDMTAVTAGTMAITSMSWS